MFWFFRYITFVMYLNIYYVYMYNKNNVFRKVKTYYNQEGGEYNLGSLFFLAKQFRLFWISDFFPPRLRPGVKLCRPKQVAHLLHSLAIDISVQTLVFCTASRTRYLLIKTDILYNNKNCKKCICKLGGFQISMHTSILEA